MSNAVPVVANRTVVSAPAEITFDPAPLLTPAALEKPDCQTAAHVSTSKDDNLSDPLAIDAALLVPIRTKLLVRSEGVPPTLKLPEYPEVSIPPEPPICTIRLPDAELEAL